MNIRSKIQNYWGWFLGADKNSNKRYSWYVNRINDSIYLREILHSGYKKPQLPGVDSQKIVYCIYDGKYHGGGLADRLRGILSTYSVCKELGVDFRLVFRHPFELDKYLVPNRYNWTDTGNELRYDIPHDNILILPSTQDSLYQKKKQHGWLKKHIKNCSNQIHVYTNASFAYENGYHELFNELFKPSQRLQDTITKQYELLASGGDCPRTLI